MKKFMFTAILLIATSSTLSFADQASDFAKQSLNLTKNAQDLKEALLNEVKISDKGNTHVYLSNLNNLKFPIFAKENSDKSDSELLVRATVFCKLMGFSRSDRYDLTSAPLGTEIASLSLNNNLIDATKENVRTTEYVRESNGFGYLFHKLQRQGRIDFDGFKTKEEGSTRIFWTVTCIK